MTDMSTLGDHPQPQVTSLLPRVSAREAACYYAGLPSTPVLVARTGSVPFDEYTGPGAFLKRKELRIVGNHAIQDVWEDDLAFKVHAVLDEKGVDWTSTDVVRIGNIRESSSRVVLWIGVKPGSLSYDDGIDVALQCKGLLLDYNIDDVDVEIRESELIHLGGPMLLGPTIDSLSGPLADVRQPFTPTIGVPICCRSTPEIEGTAGFFLKEGGDGKRLFLVTARHVVLPDDNTLFERKSESEPHRRDVLIFRDASFKQHLASIQDKIKRQHLIIDIKQSDIEWLEGKDDEISARERKRSQRQLEAAKRNVITLTAFHSELSTEWATEESRILGHVVFSPPITIGPIPEQYTQDLAIIAIDPSKIDPITFTGNVIDFGTQLPIEELVTKLYRNPKNSPRFEFPQDRLGVRGIITDDELRRPTIYDWSNEPCIVVLKRGRTTGLTAGRANNVFSYVRNYFRNNDTNNNENRISKEWPILAFDNNSGRFSGRGDSGSVVVDGAGRIGGIITGGTGVAESIDVTYATPASFVMKVIRSSEVLANATPWEGSAD